MSSAGQRPLDGYLVLDFSQFLAGPMAAMRLGDLGARVIKIERPPTGDIGLVLPLAELSRMATPFRFTSLIGTRKATRRILKAMMIGRRYRSWLKVPTLSSRIFVPV